MLTELNVSNFKSLRDVNLEFDNLTVIVGPNNSGKSAAIEALMYYREAALGDEVYSASDIPSGEYVGYDMGDPEQVFHRNSASQAESVTIEPVFDLKGEEKSDAILSQLQTAGLTPSNLELAIEAEFEEDDITQNWFYRGPDGELVGLISTVEGGVNQRIDVESILAEGTSNLSHNGLLAFEDSTHDALEEFLNNGQKIVKDKLNGTYYITDSRDINQWKDDPQERDFVGYTGQDTVSMLHGLRDDREAFEEVIEAMSTIADKTDEVVADLHESDTMTELVDSDTDEKFNIVASGSGLRRLLPVIVQIASMDDGDILFLEEPEISVFPATQERFLNYLLEKIEEKDIQVIMTTHSWAFKKKLGNQDDIDEYGHALRFDKNEGETNVEKERIKYIGPTEEEWSG